MTRLPLIALGLASFMWLGFPCSSAPPPTQVPPLDYTCFVQQVEPELLRGCAFGQCHGAPERPLRLFAPAGRRLAPNLPPTGLVDAEHKANFDRARVLAATTSSDLPDLLRKPLQLEAGGAEHGGLDRFGRNVYRSRNEPGWVLLWAWANGQCPPFSPPDAGDDLFDAGVCTTGAYGFQANIAPIVNPTRCGDSACHTPQNVLTGDAGCLLTDSCTALLASGCSRPSVLPCDYRRSKLYLYTGVPPYKAHQGKLTSAHRQVIADWIDAGAPCD